MTNPYDVVVLGAGPAGLGAAYRVARTGSRVCVLERAPAVGGLAASFEVAGMRVDHGSHRLHPSTDPAVLAVLRGLLGADLQRRPRRGRIRMAGRYVAFPPRPFDLARRFPPALAARLARDVLTAPARRAPRGAAADDSGTFADVVRASLGPTMLDAFYGPYVEKLFGVPAAELAGELARRRVGARTAGSLVARVVRPGRGRRGFYYPRRGFGQIPEVLAGAASAAGATIRTGAEVTGIRTDRDGVIVSIADGSHVAAAMAWSTLPLPVLARLAAAPAPVAQAAARLETRALVLVYLALGCGRWTRYDAHYFPARGVPFVRVSEPKNYRDSPDDPRDVTVLCAELPCAVGDATWHASADELAAWVRDALAREELPLPVPVGVQVRRVAHAYPVYRDGFEAAFAALDRWASSLPRVVHFGRQGLFAHDNTHHALAMAWAAADALGPDGLLDRERWATAREGFRSHVVED